MLTRIYKIFAWLSLDVTTGAIVFMYFLSKEFGTPVDWTEASALGLAVWVIYQVDHLLDSKVAKNPISPRREFHRRHFNSLVILSFGTVGAGIWMANLLPDNLFFYGIIMTMISGGYLMIAQLKRWSSFKELQISLGYAIGISLIPLANLEVIMIWHWLVVILLFLLALFNLILFSWFEQDLDKKEGFKSLALYFSGKNLSRILWVVVVLSITGAIGLAIIDGSKVLSIFFLLGTGINITIWKFPNFFYKSELYRIVGDAVFLSPLIWLL